MPKPRVLITGMSGLIGGIMHRALADEYDLVALNRSDVPGGRCVRADISDLEAIRPAFEDVDVVLHLAAFAREHGYWDEILQCNVVGTYNVFEAAREAGVKRVVFASSGAATSGYELESPYRELVLGSEHPAPTEWKYVNHESVTRPNGLYGCSKVWGEALGRFYTDTHKMSVICVRIGAVLKDDQPTAPRHESVYCSHRDIAQMLKKCIEAPDTVLYDIFYCVSDNRRSYRDISHAREVLGYHPADSGSDHAE